MTQNVSSKLTLLITSVSNSQRSAAKVVSTTSLGFRGLEYRNSFEVLEASSQVIRHIRVKNNFARLYARFCVQVRNHNNTKAKGFIQKKASSVLS